MYFKCTRFLWKYRIKDTNTLHIMWGSDIYVDIIIFLTETKSCIFFKKEISGSNEGMIQALHVTIFFFETAVVFKILL